MKNAFLIYIWSRALVFLTGVFYLWVFSDMYLSRQHFTELFYRWDAEHYLNIVTNGYSYLGVGGPGNTLAFYPLYPLLLKLFNFSSQNFVIDVAFGLSFLIGGLLAIVFYLYAKERVQEKNALLATALLFFAPTAVFFSSFYTEGLFALLTSAAFYLFLKERYLTSAVFCALLTVTRPNGFTVAAALIIAGLVLVYKGKLKLKKLLYFFITPIPLLLWFYYQYLNFGSPFASMVAEKTGWDNYLTWPHLALYNRFQRSFLDDLEPVWTYVQRTELLVLILAILFFLFNFKRFNLFEKLFLGLNLLIFTSESSGLGVPRFMLVLLPFFPILAERIATNKFFLWGTMIIFVAWFTANNLAFFDNRPIL